MSKNKYSLYHGMRSKKSPEQIRREGFCAYDPNADLSKDIIDALRHFKKENILREDESNIDAETIRTNIRTIRDPFRKATWATTYSDRPCGWWAHANPEHISESLSHAGISPTEIDKYLREKYGDRCYNVKLKLTKEYQWKNANTEINCIPPELIDSVEECKDCRYTGKYHGKVPPL